MSNIIFDLESYAKKARQAVAEGIVLLKNDTQILPLKKNERVALFGRNQFNYYKSGTGSGGLVNTSYEVSILDALEKDNQFSINENLKETYQNWLKDHPFDSGVGWGNEPFTQKEMPLDREIVDTARAESDIAIIIIGRTAGEDQDSSAEPGSYLLTETEEEMLDLVCKKFEKTIVLLNVGNIIDMKWVDQYNPTAVLYVWQGGQEGGNGVLDVLKGTVSPSGKLANTIAYNIEDYPSTPYFGDEKQNYYVEDIYVGYRYFETFAQDKVMYPFGYGLSYTTFDIKVNSFDVTENRITTKVTVTNQGSYSGKEVVQLYHQPPQGKLGKPFRNLAGFVKTKTLNPGESQELSISCEQGSLASYDDSGITGNKSCYVLEAGEYTFFVGNKIRNTLKAGSFVIEELEIIEKLTEAMAPNLPFERMKPAIDKFDQAELTFETVPQKTITLNDRIEKNKPKAIPFSGDQGWKLQDVKAGKVSMEDFIAQLSKEDLFHIVRGEGMSSPKVTPGIAGAFGGITEELKQLGIPIAGCADGPSGIRMDSGTSAFSIPNGTALSCSFNEELSRELFEFMGLELRKNRIDSLLGPGINIHRNPLNGRNFEYFSEDPLLTGKMTVAQLKGMAKYDVTGTIKHFSCNNQEHSRNYANAILSERALREIYLKGFEMAVKEGNASSIMTSYGPINGLWAASNYDLLTTILREEWGFDGIVMTDWWAKGNDEGETGSRKNISAMIRSQNDLYMVTRDAKLHAIDTNAAEELDMGKVTVGDYQRSAMNICRSLMKLPVFDRFNGRKSELDEQLEKNITEEDATILNAKHLSMSKELSIHPSILKCDRGSKNGFHISIQDRGTYQIKFTCRSKLDNPLAQLPITISIDKKVVKTITLTGEDTEWKTYEIDLEPMFNHIFYLEIYFAQGGLEVSECKLELKESIEEQIRAHFEN